MTSYERALGFLGLLWKGKGLYIGETAVKAKKVALYVVALDASENSLGQVVHKGVPLIRFSFKGELGKAIGKGEVAIMAIKEDKAAGKFLGLAGKEKQ